MPFLVYELFPPVLRNVVLQFYALSGVMVILFVFTFEKFRQK